MSARRKFVSNSVVVRLRRTDAARVRGERCTGTMADRVRLLEYAREYGRARECGRVPDLNPCIYARMRARRKPIAALTIATLPTDTLLTNALPDDVVRMINRPVAAHALHLALQQKPCDGWIRVLQEERAFFPGGTAFLSPRQREDERRVLFTRLRWLTHLLGMPFHLPEAYYHHEREIIYRHFKYRDALDLASDNLRVNGGEDYCFKPERFLVGRRAVFADWEKSR